MKQISIRLKITAWFSAIMILIVAVTFCTILWVDYSVMQKTIQDNLIETVEDNVDEVEFFEQLDTNENDYNDDLYIAYKNGYLEIDDDFLDKVNSISTALYRDSGELLYGENLLAKESTGLAFSDRVVRERKVNGVTYYIFDCALSAKGTEGLWLRGIVSEHQGTQQLHSLVRLSVAVLPVLLLLAIVGGYWIAARALKPVHQITEAAAQIHEGRDLKKRIELGAGSDELHQLAEVFNAMFCRLEDAFRAEQQFTSDASHELRTPMAVIMAQCEYTLEDTETAEEYREALHVIQRQGRKMSRLIEDMLCFARLEQNGEAYPKASLHVTALVEDICIDMALLKTKGITLTWDLEPDLWMEGNQTLLTRLLTNLISNGYRYGKSDGSIQVSLRRQDGILLTVTDDGIGIPPDQQEKIFERFYQGDAARTTEGTGLGLAMVKEIAQYHGGSVTVSSAVGAGSVFSVCFPI